MATLHMRAEAQSDSYAVFDDDRHLIARVKLNPTSTDDFELELDRTGETMRRWITQEDALGFARAERAVDLVHSYFPADTVVVENDDNWSTQTSLYH